MALMVLLVSSFAGLAIGRWELALPLLAGGALLGGPALGALGAAGVLAGVQLHRVVAEQY
ncbi:MAG: hypothetical protein ACRDLA_04760 [Thermoleophilaceae bacterium]